MNPFSALLALSDTERTERGFSHTLREIAQQPDTWPRTLAQFEARLGEVASFLTSVGIGAERQQRPTVFLIGAGTSDYIGHSLHFLLRSKWQCEVFPVASTTLLTDFAELVLPEQPYLWISFSRSGDSPEGVAVIERALAECSNVAHLLVSCNGAGRMHQALKDNPRALSIVLDDAVNDRSLAMTSSFTNMVLTGQMLAHAFTLDAYRPIVLELARAARLLLPQAAALAEKLAREDHPRVCFVGSGVLAGAALESALKVLEMTAGQLQTMVQPTLALRHGPMAALHADTLFVTLVATDARRRGYDLDLLREVGDKHLVQTRVAVALSGAEELRAEAEEVLTPGDDSLSIPDLYRPPLDVLFGQMLGFFASLHHGLKPDAPSPNGAISRVVQNVGIY